MNLRKMIVALTGAAGMLLGASSALAQATTVACSDTSVLPNPVFMGGSSAIEPILGQLAVQIKAKQGVSIVYKPISSCLGVSAISPPADVPDQQYLTGTADYYTVDPTDSTKVVINTCNLSGNTIATIGISDVSFDSCQGAAKPATIGEWAGPVQPMLIIVPKANVTTTAISAEQAAAIWGCGAQSGVGKFTDLSAIQQRSATSGTQILVARNIGVPESAFKGVANSSGGVLVQSLLSVPDPQTAIGFLANDAYATRRRQISSIAFRGIKQTKAYYADSDAIATDLKNVRDGHYVIQGPLHFFSKLTGTPPAPAPNAKLVLDWLTGAAPINPQDPYGYVATVAAGGDVPQCAMKVKLDKDGGKFSPFTPAVSCHCAFEKVVSPATAVACKACTADTDCTGGTRCQTGYCE